MQLSHGTFWLTKGVIAGGQNISVHARPTKCIYHALRELRDVPPGGSRTQPIRSTPVNTVVRPATPVSGQNNIGSTRGAPTAVSPVTVQRNYRSDQTRQPVTEMPRRSYHQERAATARPQSPASRQVAPPSRQVTPMGVQRSYSPSRSQPATSTLPQRSYQPRQSQPARPASSRARPSVSEQSSHRGSSQRSRSSRSSSGNSRSHSRPSSRSSRPARVRPPN